MTVALVTGAGGLVGSEATSFLINEGFEVVGVENDMRSYFFGTSASTQWRLAELKNRHPQFRNEEIDIRDFDSLSRLMKGIHDLQVVIHAAAQPSHDWAAREPFTDFGVNASGTLNMLEAVRRHAPDAAFIFLSTNKVYGDTPNTLPLVEQESRWDVAPGHRYKMSGIDELMSIDQSMHSLFGASKAAADLMVQEYGRYFGLKTACFRAGCLTGGGHSGSELHGFLAYLMKCAVTGHPYTVYGYKGKQVRDNLHATDLVAALWEFAKNPKPASVYNIGGSGYANCSMLEAIDLCFEISGKRINWTYSPDNRLGDHIWWISDIRRFQDDYPNFRVQYDIRSTLTDIFEVGKKRWLQS